MQTIDPARADLAREFKAAPSGPHSPDLQRLLQLMRFGFARGKTIILCTVPHQEWRLAKFGPRRGTAVTLVGSESYSSYAQASWACFRARWREATGQDCPVS